MTNMECGLHELTASEVLKDAYTRSIVSTF